ncbi:hypothetical protein M9H77_30593 [Catharanthus roseus]|uniref:Uncharacterized protein n=1 Tax=Catharanthus roseus TaxID=4058 RepID=A0ACB9ZYL0_CATRO|nr:hypothetical protein M9H77_30593 [Catharanthus roseus]
MGGIADDIALLDDPGEEYLVLTKGEIVRSSCPRARDLLDLIGCSSTIIIVGIFKDATYLADRCRGKQQIGNRDLSWMVDLALPSVVGYTGCLELKKEEQSRATNWGLIRQLTRDCMIAMNSYNWGGQRVKLKKAGVHNVYAISAMEARLTSVIEQKIGNLAGTSTSKNTKRSCFTIFVMGGIPIKSPQVWEDK